MKYEFSKNKVSINRFREIYNVDDDLEFMKTHESLKLLGFSDSDSANIYKILAALLHLGNVAIVGGGGRSE